MPLTVAEYKEMADLARQVGDEEAELEALEGMESTGAFSQPDYPGASVIEPARAVVSGAGRAVAGGIKGIAKTLDPTAEPGAGAKAVEEVQAGAFQPTTQAGQEGLETLGSLMEKGIDIARIPLSGLAGLAELVSGQGFDQAAETIKSVQDEGVSRTLGERVYEETESPLAATFAETIPAGALEFIGLKGAGKVATGARRAAEITKDIAVPAGKEIVEVVSKVPAVIAGKEIAEGVVKYQGPAKREIAKQITEGSQSKDLAKYKLKETTPAKGEPTAIEQFFDTRGPKIEADTKAGDAVRQGFKEGVIQPLKSSSKSDKTLMGRMTRIAERAKKDELFGMENRPGDVAGNVLMDRLNVVREANKRAGKAIKPIVARMKGTRINIQDVGQSFSGKLDDMGITLKRGESGKIEVDFSGSDIEGLSGPESVIKRVVNRIEGVAGDGSIDASRLHQLKKFIDEQVTFGKTAEGLAGETERALKGLRREINDTLGAKFPAYAEANKTYSGTIDALDAFQDVAGRKMNLLGENADKATGTLMRRLMGNAQSRITLLDSLKGIEDAVEAFGGYGGPLRITGLGGSKNSLKMLVLYADELDRVFGAAPRTSLQGQFDQALGTAARAATSQSGAVDLALGAAGKLAEKARGINEEGAFKAIKKLLNERD